MPALSDLLSPAGRAAMARVRHAHTDVDLSAEALEAERQANLDRLAQRHRDELAAMVTPLSVDDVAASMDAADEEDEHSAAWVERALAADRQRALAEGAERVRKLADAQHAADKGRELREVAPPARSEVNLSSLSDAELGRMMRAALLSVVVDELPPAMAEVLGKRKADALDRQALLDDERAERRDNPSYLLPGFTVGSIVVPDLDLTDKSMGEVVPAKVRSAYNRARYQLGTKEVLDRELTTWQMLAAEHTRLAAHDGAKAIASQPVAAPAARPDPAVEAKVAALVKVLGITEEAARARVTG